jgi:hypothetical protein
MVTLPFSLSPRELTDGMDSGGAHDPSALVRIVVVLCMIFAWLVMAARIELRRPLSKLFRLDDWTALVATGVALAQQVVVLMGLPGRSLAAAGGVVEEGDTVCFFLLFFGFLLGRSFFGAGEMIDDVGEDLLLTIFLVG